MFLSHIVLDASPFTHIVSCGILAFTALICVRIFCKTQTPDKYCVILFVPIILNPYIVSDMIFIFDNIFMMSALLCTVLSAYISIGNDSRSIPLQVIFLLSGLMFYQAALSACFIIFLYILIDKISAGEKLSNLLKTAKNQLYTMVCTAILYLPIACGINYCKREKKIFEGSSLPEYLEFVQRKIFYYFENIYSDWKDTYVGAIVSLFIIGFIISFFVKTWKNRSNYRDCIVRGIFLTVLIFAFFLAPIGVTALFNHAGSEGSENVPPRIIYTLGIVISAIMYDSSFFFKKIYFFRSVYKIFSLIFVVWNVVFATATGNLLKQQCKLQDDISRSMAEDLYDLQKDGNTISEIKFSNYKFAAPAILRAKQEYPVLERILIPQWGNPIFSDVLSKYNGHFFPHVCDIHTENPETKNAKKIVDRMWYTLRLLEDNTLVIEMKKPSITYHPSHLTGRFISSLRGATRRGNPELKFKQI
jgi:hypothetical protein